MTQTSAMLNTVMDGIRGANMMADYAESFKDMPDMRNWFITHAKKRLDMAEQDYEWAKGKIGLADKIRNGDEIAEALHVHITESLGNLHDRLDR